jgi:ribosomal protein L34
LHFERGNFFQNVVVGISVGRALKEGRSDTGSKYRTKVKSGFTLRAAAEARTILAARRDPTSRPLTLP